MVPRVRRHYRRAVWLGIFTAYHLYDNDSLRISVSSFDEVRDLFHAMLAGSLFFLILSQGVGHSVGLVDLQRRRGVHLHVARRSCWSRSFAARSAAGSSPRDEAAADADRRRAADEARLVHRKLAGTPRVRPRRGRIPRRRERRRRIRASRCSGRADDIASIVDEFDIDRVLLASSVASHEEMLDLVRTVRRPDVQVSIVPRYFEIFTSHAILDDVEGMPVVTLPPMRLGRSSRLLKRSCRHRRRRARAARPRARARGDRARDPARQPADRLSTASPGAAATDRRSRSSSSGRCASVPSRIARRCCT